MAEHVLDDAPESIVRNHDLDELLEILTSLETWAPRHTEVLDHVYRVRLANWVYRGGSIDEAKTLQDHFATIESEVMPTRIAADDRVHGARWGAYREFLGTYIAAARKPLHEGLLQRTHVADILERVVDGRARTQQDIQSQLGLKEANASRILKMMEEARLVARRRIGRENLISPGSTARISAAPARRYRRGVSLLSAHSNPAETSG